MKVVIKAKNLPMNILRRQARFRVIVMAYAKNQIMIMRTNSSSLRKRCVLIPCAMDYTMWIRWCIRSLHILRRRGEIVFAHFSIQNCNNRLMQPEGWLVWKNLLHWVDDNSHARHYLL